MADPGTRGFTRVKRLAAPAAPPVVRDGRRVEEGLYRIVVAGRLEPEQQRELDGLQIEAGDEETTLSGRIVDQAQLQGLLDRIAALRLELVSVNRIDEAARSTEGADTR